MTRLAEPGSKPAPKCQRGVKFGLDERVLFTTGRRVSLPIPGQSRLAAIVLGSSDRI